MRFRNGSKNFLVFVWGHYFMGLILVVIFRCCSKMDGGVATESATVYVINDLKGSDQKCGSDRRGTIQFCPESTYSLKLFILWILVNIRLHHVPHEFDIIFH